MTSAREQYAKHAAACESCGLVDKGLAVHTGTRCSLGKDLVSRAALESHLASKLGATNVRIDFKAAPTTDRLCRFIIMNRRKGANRDFCRGMCFGRWSDSLGTTTISETFTALWPKHKVKITAADFIMLRDLGITANV